ncbi:hypothetical protein HY637_02620 [Candidatus Woesearchaeota archaeon]|nr:hypothetical protein [Candidatus Woesearchaeota archaeon]
MTSQHKELVEELNRHRAEASKLRNTLNELDNEKESWFRKKEEISSRIRAGIQKIKENKAKRDALTKEVKELKMKRDSFNKEIKPRSEELETLKRERTEASKKLDVRESPSRLKQQMEKLEFKIETENVSFEKEKELMKKIKELKKEYDRLSVLRESSKNVRKVLDVVRKTRKDANEVHNSIQDKAKQSQILHEEILKISPEIDKLKGEGEATFKKFSELKAKFNEANSQLKEKLNAMDGIKRKLDTIYAEKREKRKREQDSFLKSKEDAVNEKIRKGEKLTTEDLLVFQKFGKG